MNLRANRRTPLRHKSFLGSGGGTRTHDKRINSPATASPLTCENAQILCYYWGLPFDAYQRNMPQDGRHLSQARPGIPLAASLGKRSCLREEPPRRIYSPSRVPSSTVPLSDQPPASATARPRSNPEMSSIRRVSDSGPNRKPVTFSTRPAHTLSGLVTAESKTTLLA